MDFVELSKKRYTCKHFDPNKKIPREDIQKLQEILRLSPSSVNSQPWVFILVHTDSHKKLIRPAVWDFNWDRTDTCSDFVVIAVRKGLTEKYQSNLIDQEVKDGRLESEEVAEKAAQARAYFIGLHDQAGDCVEWEKRQAYIAMTSLLYGAASMGIDSTPIEGFSVDQMDKALRLDTFDLTSVLLVTLGYRSEADHNATRPKSRLEPKDVIFNIPE